MILGTYLQMDSVILPLPSMNVFDKSFCSVDFMLRFTNLMIFRSSYMGAPVAQWVKRWPTDLADRVRSSLEVKSSQP